jgi:hypothetical protein
MAHWSIWNCGRGRGARDSNGRERRFRRERHEIGPAEWTTLVQTVWRPNCHLRRGFVLQLIAEPGIAQRAFAADGKIVKQVPCASPVGWLFSRSQMQERADNRCALVRCGTRGSFRAVCSLTSWLIFHSRQRAFARGAVGCKYARAFRPRGGTKPGAGWRGSLFTFQRQDRRVAKKQGGQVQPASLLLAAFASFASLR